MGIYCTRTGCELFVNDNGHTVEHMGTESGNQMANQAEGQTGHAELSSRVLVEKFVPSFAVDRVTRVVDYVSRVGGCQEIYDETRRVMTETGKRFSDSVLEAMGLSVRVARADVDRIPTKGALVVVANHPYGGVEGVVLASLVGRVRGDVKILGNEMLEVFAELKPDLISVDVFGGEESGARNSAGMRAALRHLRNGGCLIVFPAGEVSHFSMSAMGVTDSPWRRGVETMVRYAGASVLPVFVPGGNGVLFNLAGLVHPNLRTALLPRAMVAQRGRSMEIRVGSVLLQRKIAEMPEGDLTDEMRRRVYMLQHRPPEAGGTVRVQQVGGEEVIAETPQALVEREVAGLPEEALLVPGADYCAYVARPGQIPHVLREIGRLREITFRAVGEGTGRSVDLDEFDQHYLHLFVWSAKDKQVVGAYRIGRVDLILKAKGVKGLYTSTLFNYPEKLLTQIGGALEMGRSFIREEYQKSHHPLLMLWKGIATFVARNPRYHTLFGPVSISASYTTISRQLMVRFLSMSGLKAEGAEMVRPRTPFKERRFDGLDEAMLLRLASDPDAMDDWISHVESDSKGIPVLLNQYLKLGARVLACNVDKDFGGCLDALVTVDLRKADRKLLSRYMGKVEAEMFQKSLGSTDAVARQSL